MAKEQWGSRLGVIMAVAGSAIGLGNFLRFPGLAARYGGAFMIPYFTALLLLGLPLMWIEWTIGRFGGGFGHSTAPGMFHSMWEKNRFIKYFGAIGILGPVLIFIYYVYIESWLLGYSVFAGTGRYAACATAGQFKAFLNGYRGLEANAYFSGIGWAYFFFVLTFAANIWVLFHGIRKGIQRLCEWAMPVLMVMAVVLVVRVFTLGTPDPAHPERNVLNGLGMMWNPDWAKLVDFEAWHRLQAHWQAGEPAAAAAAALRVVRSRIWLDAAGQVFFTLSVGIGVILTYASYLKRKDDVALSGLTAAAANEVAEVVLGGSIVIPAAFVFFGAGAVVAFASLFDLGFVAMPMVLQHIAFSRFFGVLWYALLFIAGITSSVSLAQPAVAFLEDEFDLSRGKAVAIFAVATFILCHMAIFGLAYGVVDELDFWGGTFCLVLFGTVETILFGWVFGMDRAWTELHVGSDITIPRIYRWIIRYVTPLILAVILAVYLVQDGWPLLWMAAVAPRAKPVILLTRMVIILLLTAVLVLVRLAWRRRRAREVSP